MDKVAGMAPNQRAELFRQTAARRGLREAIVEKDFWVCWVLMKLFNDPSLHSRLVFKGGTSLSKVFKLIDRFSEDVDLILDWELLGYGPDTTNPRRPLASKTQQDRFNKEMSEKAAEHIRGPLLAQLASIFKSVPAVAAEIDSRDPHCIDVGYPAAFAAAYVLPKVRLEIGPLGSWVPSSQHVIRPYASEEYPGVFQNPECSVVAIAAERTFWEKATILHKEAHRKGSIAPRHSRHYYDLYKLATSPIRAAALANLGLLNDVVAFKDQFYPSAWARYDLAKPGTFRLLPQSDHAAELERDYREMSVMLFAEAPAFDEILGRLGELEAEINLMPR